MVNVGLGWSSFVGLCLVVAGVALYALRSLRPNLARDHDIFFSAVALVCGGILFFNGWRQDPILQFGQFLLTGSAIFFAYDGIRLRGIVTQQAKRSSPIVDDERPVSSSYRTYDDSYEAELEELEPAEYPPTRRIPGTRETRRPTRDAYEDESRRPPRRSSTSRSNSATSSSSRRPRPTDDRPSSANRYDSRNRYEDWDSDVTPESNSFATEDPYLRDRDISSSDRPRSSNDRSAKRPKPKRPKSTDFAVSRPDLAPSIDDATPVDYYDYRPPQSSGSGNEPDVEYPTTTGRGNSRPSKSSKPKSKTDFDVKAPPSDYGDRPVRYPEEDGKRTPNEY